MRLLVLGVSAIALGACSVGSGYSWKGSQSGYGHAVDYTPGHYGSYQSVGHTSGSCGVAVDPCGTYNPPVYTPPTPPVQSPCAPVTNPCAGTYSVGGYSHAYDSYAGGNSYGYDYSGPAYGYGASYAHPNKFYGTLGAIMYDFDDEVFGLQGRLGYEFTPSFGAELEGSIGLIDETEDLGGGDERVTSVDYQVAALGTFRAPISNRLNAVARLGYHTTRLVDETTIGAVTTETETDEDGLAYGIGAEFALSPVSALRADYTAYEVDSGTLDSLSLSYLRRF